MGEISTCHRPQAYRGHADSQNGLVAYLQQHPAPSTSQVSRCHPSQTRAPWSNPGQTCLGQPRAKRARAGRGSGGLRCNSSEKSMAITQSCGQLLTPVRSPQAFAAAQQHDVHGSCARHGIASHCDTGFFLDIAAGWGVGAEPDTVRVNAHTLIGFKRKQRACIRAQVPHPLTERFGLMMVRLFTEFVCPGLYKVAPCTPLQPQAGSSDPQSASPIRHHVKRCTPHHRIKGSCRRPQTNLHTGQ